MPSAAVPLLGTELDLDRDLYIKRTELEDHTYIYMLQAKPCPSNMHMACRAAAKEGGIARQANDKPAPARSRHAHAHGP